MTREKKSTSSLSDDSKLRTGIAGFFERLVMPGSGQSHKRFIAVIAAFVVFIMAIVSLFGVSIDDFVIGTVAGIAMGQSVTTLFEKKK